MTQKNFETALKKGEAGERIIQSILEKQGFSVYKPVTNGAHAFDILTIKNKKIALAMDVKAKARMNKYNATGVNQKHFIEYKYFSERYNMPFVIVFVDEKLKQIYGNRITELEKPITVEGVSYPKIIRTYNGTEIRCWSLESMKIYAQLSDIDVEELSKHNQRNYDYAFE